MMQTYNCINVQHCAGPDLVRFASKERSKHRTHHAKQETTCAWCAAKPVAGLVAHSARVARWRRCAGSCFAPDRVANYPDTSSTPPARRGGGSSSSCMCMPRDKDPIAWPPSLLLRWRLAQGGRLPLPSAPGQKHEHSGFGRAPDHKAALCTVLHFNSAHAGATRLLHFAGMAPSHRP